MHGGAPSVHLSSFHCAHDVGWIPSHSIPPLTYCQQAYLERIHPQRDVSNADVPGPRFQSGSNGRTAQSSSNGRTVLRNAPRNRNTSAGESSPRQTTLLPIANAQRRHPGGTCQLTLTCDRYKLTPMVAAREEAATRWWVQLHQQYPRLATSVMAMFGYFGFLVGVLLFTCLVSWVMSEP